MNTTRFGVRWVAVLTTVFIIMFQLGGALTFVSAQVDPAPVVDQAPSDAQPIVTPPVVDAAPSSDPSLGTLDAVVTPSVSTDTSPVAAPQEIPPAVDPASVADPVPTTTGDTPLPSSDVVAPTTTPAEVAPTTTDASAPILPSPEDATPAPLPELSTDKGDYHPGETATIFGRFFGALQHVFLTIFGGSQEDGDYTETTQEVTADAGGSFTTTYTLDDAFRPIYTIVAKSAESTEPLAQVTFTDSITFGTVATAANSQFGATTLQINKPLSTANGDFLIADITVNGGSGTTITPPSGWTLVSRTNNGTNVGQAIYYHFAGASEGSNYTWTITNNRASGAIVRYTGVDTINPIDVFGASTGSGSSVQAPSVTTTVANDVVLAFFTSDANTSYATASGASERFDVTNNNAAGPATAGDDFIQAAAGATGAKTATAANAAWVAQTVALRTAPTQPDLTVTKTNSLGGASAGVGVAFDWVLDVANSGTTATFASGQTILSDNLPTTGASYGTPVVTTTGGVAGNVACSVVSNNLACTASGGSVVIPQGGALSVSVPTTPSATGSLQNPRSGGSCAVDPSTLITESSEGNNACATNTVTVITYPDLTVTKTNDLAGNAQISTLFNWILTINNTGASASFLPSTGVLLDSLPSTGASYGTPVVTYAGGVSGTVGCSIASNDLTCTSTGSLTIPVGGTITVKIPVTPTALGSLVNPRAGGSGCAVDPSTNVAESSEVNNGCANTVTVVDSTPPTVVSINRSGTATTSAASVSWTVTFSESVSGVDAGDFSLINGGLTGVPAITSVTGSATTWTVTASTGGGQGTLGLNLVDNDTIVDTSSNKLGGAGAGNGDFTGQSYAIDHVAPTVTVDQALAQVDPTSASPINFTVVFSEPISGFTTSDVTISGTTGGTKTVVISGSGPTYNVAVSGMTTSGTVIASIAASRVTDAVGNANTASTATDNSVQYNFPTFDITASAGTGGTISPSGIVAVNQGSSQAFAIAPGVGYIVSTVTVDAASQGWLDRYTFSNVQAAHTIDATFEGGWKAPALADGTGFATPGNAFASDNAYATGARNAAQKYANFGFGIPAGATIDGIEVAVEGFKEQGSTVNKSFDVALSWNNSTYTTTKNTGDFLNTQDKLVVLGSPTDKWGRTWSVSDFSDANFRLRATAIFAVNATAPLDLDQVQVKVFYTPDATAPTLAEVTPVSLLTNDNTPNYTFSSSEAGTITYGGDCAATTTAATVGNNSITFNLLGDGVHSNCTITVTDAAGNPSTPLSVSAFTVDTLAPVITVSGNDPETATFGSTYVDAGATTNDGSAVVMSGSVDTSIVADYVLTYNATDVAGNVATSKTRTVHVVKAASLTVITCPVSVSYTGVAQEPCSATVTGVGGLNASTTVTYDANINAGVATAHASFAGDVAHEGSSATDVTFEILKITPVCTITGYTGTYDAAAHGATGSCTGLGDTTLSGLDLGASFTNVPGGTAHWVFTDVTGNYADQSGDVAITLAKADPTITVTPYSVSFDGTAHTATGDAKGVSGESLSGLDLTGTTHTNAGTYTGDAWSFTDVTGNYTNQTGTVDDAIVDGTAPTIAAHADVIVEATGNTGATVNYINPTATDDVDGAITVTCLPSSATVFTFGTTTVSCDAQDLAGNHAPTTHFAVSVVDTTKPVITILGSTSTMIEIGTVYVDAGATALDNIDGDITPGIVTASTVNTAIIGDYSVTYNVVDSHGNAAVEKTRVVHVVDHPAPVITQEAASVASTTSVTITWTTDHPATSRVVFDVVSHNPAGVAPSYGYASSTSEDTTKVTNHSVLVTGLIPGTTYYFRAVSHGSPETISKEIVQATTQNTGTLIVTKNTVGGDGTFGFTGNAGAFSISTISNTGMKIIANLVAGLYSITETPLPGWVMNVNGCTNVNVSVGQTANCTITNTKLPTLTVNKVVIPANDSGKFKLMIDGTAKAVNVGNGGTTGAVIVSLGSHTVAELAGAGTSLTGYTAVISGDCNADGTITLSAGDNKICTITNTKKTISLGKISGMKYNDVNRNGKKDANEVGLKGWKIRLIDEKGKVTTTTTDTNGKYSFDGLKAGVYTLRETHQKGWIRMSVNPRPVTIVNGSDVTNINFGNAKIQRGDREDNDTRDNLNDWR